MDNQQQPQGPQRGPFGQVPPQQPASQTPWHAHPGQQWPTQQWPPASWPAPGGATWSSGAVPPRQPPTTPPGTQPGSPAGKAPRRHRAVPALVAAALVVAAAAGGVGIGHVLWPGSQSASGSPIALSSGGGTSSGNSQSGGSSSTPGGSGSTGSGTTGNGNNGNGNNNGSGGSGGNDGNGNSGNNNGNGNPGNGGLGTWPPSLLPGGLLPGQGQWPGDGSGGNGNNGSGSTVTSAPGSPSDVTGIRSKVDDAIVDINVTFAYQQAAGAGTGIVLTPTGEILTNNHVIDGATGISVTDLGNGKTYSASVVGYDTTGDIAVLQLKGASGLATATIGNSKTLAVGDGVVGIGNAGGVGGTPSAAGGSVTALNRSISVGDELYGTTSHLTGLIEVNADIQSGDSGGPLVTSSGAVVGMDTAASAGPVSMDGSGDGYAIPIDTAMSVAKVIESGTGTSSIHVGPTAALGVLISTTGSSTGDQYPGRLGSGNSGGGTSAQGALVAGVVNGGAAAKAGLTEGDVITSLGGHTVTSSTQLSRLMGGYRPGQSVKVGWTDANGQSHTSTITLGTGPAA